MFQSTALLAIERHFPGSACREKLSSTMRPKSASKALAEVTQNLNVDGAAVAATL